MTLFLACGLLYSNILAKLDEDQYKLRSSVWHIRLICMANSHCVEPSQSKSKAEGNEVITFFTRQLEKIRKAYLNYF